MATLFKGTVTLQNGVTYGVNYEVSASYTGTTYTLLNGGTGLDGSVTFKVKTTNYAWTKDVEVGINFEGGDSISEGISFENDDYTTHKVTLPVTPGKTRYGSLSFWIRNKASSMSWTLAEYSGAGITSVGKGITDYYTGGLCGIYPTDFSLSTSLNGDKLPQQESKLDEGSIDLNYYWSPLVFKAEISHSSGYEKRTPSYKIAFYEYKVDENGIGTRAYYPTTQEYSWTIDKTDYTETIQQSIPLFLKEGSFLDYPIREYFLYYNGTRVDGSDSFYVTPFSFNLPNTVIAKQNNGGYEAEVNLGNLNKWVDLNYKNLNLIFGAQGNLGEITKENNILVGKVTNLEKQSSKTVAYEIYKDQALITRKEINTIFGLDFECENILVCKILKNKEFNDFKTLQRGEKIKLSMELEETTGVLETGEEVKIVLMVCDEKKQKNAEILRTTIKWEQGKSKQVIFDNITINDLIEIDSNKENKFYLKIISNDIVKEKTLNLKILAYDYTKTLNLEDKIKYELTSGSEKKNGQCKIKENSFLEISFLKDQFKDNLEIEIAFTNQLSYNFNQTDYSKKVDYNNLRNLLNDSSETIPIIPTQKNTKEIPYTIIYRYDNIDYTISTEEKLIVTIPPLLIPTLAYRNKQVGINCEPSDKAVLDIKAEQVNGKNENGEEITKNFTKVRFQNMEGTETGYIDLQNGELKSSSGNDVYLKKEAYEQQIKNNTQNIETNTSNITAIVSALQNYSIGVQGPKDSGQYYTYKAFGDSGSTKSVTGSFTFENIPSGSKCKAIIETIFIKGSRDDFDDGTKVSITSESFSGTSYVIDYKAEYIERIVSTNGSYFVVRAYLLISTIPTIS